MDTLRRARSVGRWPNKRSAITSRGTDRAGERTRRAIRRRAAGRGQSSRHPAVVRTATLPSSLTSRTPPASPRAMGRA
ncbi:hypothetical protein [Ornithinimicrobium kibberense]|uniref:hypothetical protein n=1 Tax=Ornithinimicrobium kibberense TaxID=282060 RepID=UPI00360B1865